MNDNEGPDDYRRGMNLGCLLGTLAGMLAVLLAGYAHHIFR